VEKSIWMRIYLVQIILKLSFQNYSPITYTQHNSKQFIKNLSILDLLMNMGPKSLEQMKNIRTFLY